MWPNALDSVTRKMLLPLALASSALLLAVLGILWSLREQSIEAAGVATAQAIASQTVNLRQFYTAEIATRAQQAGMQLDSDFEQHAHTLPLPATLVKALGQSIGNQFPGMSIRLYSHYPFPNRAASETYDDFELQALDALIANPEQVQTRVERRDGRRLVRLVTADRMQAACVACHNSRSDTPRNDWKVGDVRGAIEVTVPVDRLEAEIDRAILGVGLALLTGIVALVSVAILATRRAAAALQQLNRELETRVEARTNDLSRANADLHLALHHIERSEPLAALGALIAGMAHELNTPMANAGLVLGTLTEHIEALRRAVAEKQLRSSQLQAFLETTQQACALLQRNILRASELVADFKQVSADQTSRRRRTFNLAELVEETLHTLAPSHRHSPVQISTAIPADIELDSYPGPLEQVIGNLVNNAVLHGLNAEQTLHIQITAERLTDTAAVRLSLSDDGQGMSPEVAAQAFQPFFTTRLGTGGTGLGLHLVHKLIQEPLGGSLALDSQPGHGTRFSIHLPLVAPQASDNS